MAGTIEQVRLLIPDTEAVFDGTTLFTDDDLDGYLEIAAGSALRAAGYAILAIANSEAMISKVIRSQDLSTDGSKVADALRATVRVLFARADREENKADEFYYNVVDYPTGTDRPELTEWNWNP